MAKHSVARAAKTALTQDTKLRDKAKVADSYANFAAALGLGTGNLSDAGGYGYNPVTRIRTVLEWIHRGSWLGGIAIDVVADDMTKMGVELRGEIEPKDIEHLDRAATSWGIWNAVNDTIKWSRLYGGAIAMMMIDGQDPKTPLRADTVGKGQFRGMLVLDRWMVEPSLNDLVTEMGPDVGLPKFYTVTADAPALPHMRIHYSRVLRLEGVRLPYWQRLAENLWGLSVLERLWDRMLAFDSASTGAAQLVYKSYLRTYKIDGLREVVSSGGDALGGLMRQIDFMRRTQTIEGITLLDAKDDFATFQYSFAGLSDVLLQFGQQIAGALQIPLVRLFGQSPAGMNATGESDLRTYYDGIKMQQEKSLKVPLTRMYRVMAASEGIRLPEGFTIDFRPLWQLTDAEKVQTSGTLASTITGAYDAGIIKRETALRELRQGSKLTGVFTNITDEDIEEASEEPPPGSLEATAQQLELQNAMQPESEEENSDKTKDAEYTQPEGTIPQGTALRAKQSLQFKHPTTGRINTIKEGSSHWVGNSGTHQKQHGVVEVVKQGHPMGSGVHMPHAAVREHFHIVDAIVKDQMLGDRSVLGFPVVIEHEKFDDRYGRILPAAYGYLRRTDSAERGDQMDCFVGSSADATKIFIVDSYRPDGSFDEHKIMLGFADETEAALAFRTYYYDRRFNCVEVAAENLRSWLTKGDVTVPYTQPFDSQYTPTAKNSKEVCAKCKYFNSSFCVNKNVARDPKVPSGVYEEKIVSPTGWCKEFKKGAAQ